MLKSPLEKVKSKTATLWWSLGCCLCVWAFPSPGLCAAETERQLTFERDIRPILREHCFDCHGANQEKEGELDLRLRRLIVQGGESGAAIEPGSPDDSLLLQRVREGEMPPRDKKVTSAQIAILTQWISQGATTARDEPTEIEAGIGITPEERAFWAFQPIKRPAPPSVTARERVRTAIDAFVLGTLESSGLSFAPDADRRTLIRRAYLDLIGLPPTIGQVEAFVHDARNDSYDRLLDRLLASPHYGERWGRHWLDVAGYADSEGYTNADANRPWAYQFRDYIIRALNSNKPLDQFIREQLAGDEMLTPPYRNLTGPQIDKLTATGFLRMAADGTGSGENNDEARNQTVADTIKIVSSSLLGLSVGCAQCHDHRYDPIPQVDYYQLRAIFEPALDVTNWRTPQNRLISLYTDEDRAVAAKIEEEAKQVLAQKKRKQDKYIDDALVKELAKHDDPLREQLRQAYKTPGGERTEKQNELLKKYPSTNITPGNLYQYNQKAADELKEYDKQVASIRARKPVEAFIRSLTETPDNIPVTHVFHRGDYKQPKQSVLPAALAIAAMPGQRFKVPANNQSLKSSGRRLAYARWLTNGRHPLVARVLVNRVWMHHFGRGIVATPGDFGKLGQPPSHPELLDWLADELMASGWNLKRLHKRIMSSTTYRQSSVGDPSGAGIDAGNLLYWKYPLRRLDAEIVRDRILWTSGQLTNRQFGPPVQIKSDDSGQVVVDSKFARRSVYITAKRTQPVAMLKAFDAPVMQTNCVSRPSSTAATQSLMLMNSNFALQQAKYFAQRILRDTSNDDVSTNSTAGIQRAWHLAYSRAPTDVEVTQAAEFLRVHLGATPEDSQTQDAATQALTHLCQALLSSNEFLYVD